MNKPITKHYRPYVSHLELLEIISLLPPDSSLCKKLKLYEYKISQELVSPASTFSKPLTTLEKLGGTSPEEARYMNGEMTPEEEDAYVAGLMQEK
jgi:hypothetical protein